MTLSKRDILRRALLVVQILLLLPILWFIYHLVMPRGFTSTTAEVLPLVLSSGKFETTFYPVKDPKGIVIVATGDGGWSNQFEEPLARHLSAAGFAVGGWDCRKFADTRKFDQARLTEAFNAAVNAVRKRAGMPEDTPVWYTGWSTGAEWSLAAAAIPAREKHLVGVLAAAPGDRSRYGISASDLLGLDPSGPDTFALADLAPGLKGIRVVQFAAALDVMDDVKWIEALGPESPHKVVTIPSVPHDMGGAGPRFQSDFDMAVQWTLDTSLPPASR